MLVAASTFDNCVKVRVEVLWETELRSIKVGGPQGIQIRDYRKILAAKGVTRIVHRSKHASEIRQAKVVDVLIENVEEGSVFANPIQTRNFNIDSPCISVGVLNQLQETDRILNMFQNMAEHNAIRSETKFGSVELSADRLIVAFM